jgi:hypothetical protein
MQALRCKRPDRAPSSRRRACPAIFVRDPGASKIADPRLLKLILRSVVSPRARPFFAQASQDGGAHRFCAFGVAGFVSPRPPGRRRPRVTDRSKAGVIQTDRVGLFVSRRAGLRDAPKKRARAACIRTTFAA